MEETAELHITQPNILRNLK